ncbi:NAD(P)/FAD-dependent oxidoreductase [Sphingobacterium sp. UGAL515B_05]|uniref:FAD-dependent oxidoreductase n=1 Tax=Sphingobacterium sp. UGAL515B_05 TaxID=2986767 RepID=UPI00295322A4|nr:NAD(P)/FAD-dependent oxidoreductase [Sphingobacterium sp. UGAL515B_05]WON95201.1 FAD-dependent monooxygenase [Sphingobacterium sp. UGAL515B_05]
MLTQNKKIAIVGGGMGGLTLARLLQLHGADVSVYERDLNRNIRVQGSTLDLHEGTGLEAMKRAGLLAEFYKYHRPTASKLRIVDKGLVVKFDDHDDHVSAAENRPEIDRAPLRDILLNSLEERTVIWDSQFVAMEKSGEGWLLSFKNKQDAYADLVIGADGANSKVRPYLSDVKAVYAGITLIEGNIYEAKKNVPNLFELTKGGKVMAFGEGQFIGYGTKEDGSVMFVASTKMPENELEKIAVDFRDKKQVLHWFKNYFSGWDSSWYEFFTNDSVQFIPRPQYYFPLDQNWETQTNLTIIGDAAHRMPPFAGEGANVAMQDAFELTECLTNGKHETLLDAIGYFEKDMIRRGAEATQDTLENSDRMHSTNALSTMLAFFGQSIKD